MNMNRSVLYVNAEPISVRRDNLQRNIFSPHLQDCNPDDCDKLKLYAGGLRRATKLPGITCQTVRCYKSLISCTCVVQSSATLNFIFHLFWKGSPPKITSKFVDDYENSIFFSQDFSQNLEQITQFRKLEKRFLKMQFCLQSFIPWIFSIFVICLNSGRNILQLNKPLCFVHNISNYFWLVE